MLIIVENKNAAISLFFMVVFLLFYFMFLG